jgi:hypothetical protein
MKRIIFLILPIVLMTACVESLDDWNVDQKKASAVPPKTLFTNATKSMIDIITTPNVNSNNFRMFVQYWATTTYLDEPRYNMTARLYSQNQWYAAYRDALSDLNEAKRLINDDAITAADIKNNQIALVEIMEVYSWNFLVNTFGDVPYTEALDSDNLLPAYDDAATVYADLLVRLDAAIAKLTPGVASFGTADVIYGGSAAKWILFANSLKLKMGMLLVDVDNGKAKTLVEQAAQGGVILMSTDRARFPYISAPPNNNPVSANLNKQFTSREDFVVTDTLVGTMNWFVDPRREFYFTQVNGEYKGGKYGFSNTYANYSHVSAKIIEPTFEGLFIDPSEIAFLLAEAKERGFTIPTLTGDKGALSTAEDFYNYGVTSSVEYWGGSAASYLTSQFVDYDNFTYVQDPDPAKYFNPKRLDTPLEKIAIQKWIALNNRGWDAWVEWRRLDLPAIKPPGGPTIPTALTIPTRMIYPVIEQTTNTDQWSTAAGRYNSDSPAAKLFWDKN